MRLAKRLKSKIHFSYSRLAFTILALSTICFLLSSCGDVSFLYPDETEAIDTTEEVVSSPDELPLTTSSGEVIAPDTEAEEVNSAVECDPTNLTPEPSDNCNVITGTYYHPGSTVIVYYRQPVTNLRTVLVPSYTPEPSHFDKTGKKSTLLLPHSVMFAKGQPVFQGTKVVTAKTLNTTSVIRATTPKRSTATFITRGSSITGGKVSVGRSTRGISFGSGGRSSSS